MTVGATPPPVNTPAPAPAAPPPAPPTPPAPTTAAATPTPTGNAGTVSPAGEAGQPQTASGADASAATAQQPSPAETAAKDAGEKGVDPKTAKAYNSWKEANKWAGIGKGAGDLVNGAVNRDRQQEAKDRIFNSQLEGAEDIGIARLNYQKEVLGLKEGELGIQSKIDALNAMASAASGSRGGRFYGNTC